MKRTTQQLGELLGGVLKGQPDAVLEAVASLRNAGPRDLSYAEEKFYGDARQSKAGCILVRSGDLPGQNIILVSNPKLSFAKAAEYLYAETKDETFIHPTAIVETGATVGKGTRIGAGCTIGAGVRIGDGCILDPRVTIYPNVEIGSNVIIHAGAVIGADGFGFVRDRDRYVKFPQVGRVVIEDDVEIGANTCIDRGSLETTIIRRGTKLDNLIQIAHNVEIGAHTVIAAQTGISGSSTVGDHSILGGQVGIGEHAHLDANTIIGGQGGVLNGKHIRGGEVLWGTPVRPLKEFLEQQAHLARLPRWMEQIKRKLFGDDKSVS
jgi:UDP-3-O-[3-hydroxymyristoyl] glucosamine N-acyltransferase